MAIAETKLHEKLNTVLYLLGARTNVCARIITNNNKTFIIQVKLLFNFNYQTILDLLIKIVRKVLDLMLI